MTDSQWTEVLGCFDTDDGSLPSIEITKLSPIGLSAIYSMLRTRSRLVGERPEFWSSTEEISIPIDMVSDAPKLVAAGKAEAFHHCIEGVIAGNVELPILGIFVWQDVIELDYRMGKEWNLAKVKGFFELLHDCCKLDRTAEVVPAQSEGPPYPERFMKAWSAYTCDN